MVGVGFGEEDDAGGGDDEGGGEGEAPGEVGAFRGALGAVDKGDVDENAAVVRLHGLGDGVGDAELGGEVAAGVGEKREREVMLLDSEVVLARELGGDGDEEGAAFADGGEGGLPGFEFRHAIRAPAAAEEGDDEGADGKEVGGVDELAVDGVGKVEGGGGGADGEDAGLDVGGEEVLDGVVCDGEALGLDESAGLGGDVIELGLKAGRHLVQV